MTAGACFENTAEELRRRKLVPLALVKLFSAPDRTFPAWAPGLVSDGVLRRSWSWLAVVPAEPSLKAPREEATSRGERRVFTELESERRAWYRRRPRAQLGSLGGGGRGGAAAAGAAGLFLDDLAVLPSAKRTGKEMRKQTKTLGSMADLQESTGRESV